MYLQSMMGKIIRTKDELYRSEIVRFPTVNLVLMIISDVLLKGFGTLMEECLLSPALTEKHLVVIMMSHQNSKFRVWKGSRFSKESIPRRVKVAPHPHALNE